MVNVTGIIRLFSFLIIISFLLPIIRVGGVGFKPDLIFLILIICLFPFLDQRNITERIPILKRLSIVAILLFIVMLLSNTVGLIYYHGESGISFPTEYIQVFSRVSVFYLFVYVAYNQIISYNTFIKFVTFVFFTALVWGGLQFFNIGIVDQISLRYAISDVQSHGFSSSNFRGFGTAGNILTWGGLSIMLFYFFFFLVKNRLLKVSGSILAVVNVLLTASRSSLIALILSFVLVHFVKAIFIDKSFTSFIKKVILILVLVGGAFYLFMTYMPDRYELLEYRFLSAEEDLTESGRGAQSALFLGLLNADSLNYIFGFGKPVVDSLSYLEIEFLYLLACYGIVGLVLHYLLVFYVVKTAFLFKEDGNNIHLFVIAATLGFLIFSLGFFFLREAHSGLPFWWLTGYVIGYLFRFHKTMNY